MNKNYLELLEKLFIHACDKKDNLLLDLFRPYFEKCSMDFKLKIVELGLQKAKMHLDNAINYLEKESDEDKSE